MAITLTHQNSNVEGSAGSTISLTHTVGSGSGGLLLVVIMYDNDNYETVNSIVWDAVGANEPLTGNEIGSGYTIDDDGCTRMYYLTNPTPGTNKDITVTFSASLLHGACVVAYSLTGVDTSSPIVDYDGESNSYVSTTGTASLIGLTAGDFIVGGSTFEETADTCDWTGSSFSTTEVVDSVGSICAYSSCYGFAASASEDVECLWTGTADNLTIMGVAIAQASASTTLAPTTLAPTTLSPTTLPPTTLEPTTLPPTTLAPTTSPPTTVVPTTEVPTTTSPTTLEPTTLHPTTLQPSTIPPTTLQPTTIVPTTLVPTTIPSFTTSSPATILPTSHVLTTLLSTTLIPTTEVPLTQCEKDFWEELSSERLEPTTKEECSLTKPWLW